MLVTSEKQKKANWLENEEILRRAKAEKSVLSKRFYKVNIGKIYSANSIPHSTLHSKSININMPLKSCCFFTLTELFLPKAILSTNVILIYISIIILIQYYYN